MWLWAAVLLEVDKAHPVAVRARCRAVGGGCAVIGVWTRGWRKAAAAETGSSGGELTGDLGVGPVELFGAQTDVSGERFRLGLPGRPFRWAGAAHVGDRKVLSDSESRVLGVFDAVDDAALGCADVAGTVAGYPSGLPQ